MFCMDITREARRSAMTASDGLSRRRKRSSDDGHAEMMQEGVRLRDRREKKERDRESMSRRTRRRSERFAVRNERDTEEDSSDESLGDEDARISQSSALFQQNYLRKSFPPGRVPWHATAKMGLGPPSLKVADEMIGVPVPRKARSACIKRAHDCRTSSGSVGGGFGDDYRRPPASPASYSFEAASPSSLTVSVMQKMNANGSKSGVPKPLKSSGTTEDDLEFEIAEVLSGMKKQPRTSKKEDDSENSLTSTELKVAASEMMKKETDILDSSAVHLENGSMTSTVGTETGQSGNNELSMAKPEKSSGFRPESHRTAGIEATVATQNEARVREQPGSSDGVREMKRQDLQDSSETKGVSEGPQSKSGREESNTSNKLEIDLMVPPPMPSSPERDSLLPMASDPKLIALDYNKPVSSIKSKKETSLVIREKKVQNREWLKLDLEKPSQDDVRDSSLGSQNQDQSQEQQAKSAQPSSVLPSPIPVGSWPNGLPPLGYVPQLHTLKPVDRVTGSSPKVQAAPFAASQPRPKRCATHFSIAWNIQLHQQFVKTNHVGAPNPGPVSLNGGGSMPNNLYVIPPTAAEGLIHGNPSAHGGLPILSLNSLGQDKGRLVVNIPTPKDKAYETSNSAESTQKKPQLPAASSNLVPSPAFIFPINHHEHPVMGSPNPSVPPKSACATNNPSLSNGSTSISFSYPSSSAGEASPYLTILPNNGYSFHVSTPPAVRGGVPGQALPFFNGSLYSPQMFQPPQLLQKQGQAHKETSTSSGSSSSHWQPHPQVVGSSRLSPANTQKQHLRPTTHQSHKPETKTCRDNSPLVSDSRGSHTLRSSNGQNTAIPVQPLNFSMSFASFGGNGAPTSLNFASNGYHIIHAPQVAQPKNQQPSDTKTGGCPIDLEDSKRTVLGKAPLRTNGQTLVFDNSARTLNFMSDTWPSHAVTATTVNSTSPASTPKHHTPQRQQQQQLSGRSKLVEANTLPATSLAAKFPNSVISVFPQIHSQANPVPARSAQWKNTASSSSLTSCSSLNLKQFQSQQQIRTPGQTQISFVGAPKPVLVQASEGQQERLSSSRPQYQASPVAGSDPHGKTSSSKTGLPATSSASDDQQQQQIENSASGSNQKSSPVCGRNLPSIISSCPGHLSELKY